MKNVRLSRVYSKVSDRLIIVFKQENDILISDYQRYLPFLLLKKDFVNVKFFLFFKFFFKLVGG